MARRKRFSGHRDHFGRFILGMQDVPPPGIQTGDDNASSDIAFRSSHYSGQRADEIPQRDDATSNEDYPFGRGGVYIIPAGTK